MKITPVKDCVTYIESCGWKLIHKKSGTYWFKGLGGRTNMAGNDTITFSITELRHAKNFGW